MRISYIY